MFDVKAGENPIIITSLDIHARIKMSVCAQWVKVFAKQGSHLDGNYKIHPRNMWEKICDKSVTPAGYFKRTIISETAFQSVTISGDVTQAFFVMLEKTDLRYSKSTQLGETVAGNSDLEILEGTGVKGEFGRTFSPRVFNGYVKYRVVESPGSVISDVIDTEQADRTLTTSFAGKNGHYGNMFNVHAIGGSVTVAGMDVHIRPDVHIIPVKPVKVKVYTKTGEYQGNERDAFAWVLICDIKVTGKGVGKPTTIYPADFTPVLIEQGKTQGFYVTTETKGGIRYSKQRKSVSISDDIIEIKDGAGLKYPFGIGKSIYEIRGFNGSINYSASLSEVSAVAVAMDRRELLTTFARENGSFGICFDIKAKNHITFEGIDIHTRSPSEVSIELYTKEAHLLGTKRILVH